MYCLLSRKGQASLFSEINIFFNFNNSKDDFTQKKCIIYPSL